MHMMRKEQVQEIHKGESLRRATFIAELFGVALSTQEKIGNVPFLVFLFFFLQHSLSGWGFARIGKPWCSEQKKGSQTQAMLRLSEGAMGGPSFRSTI